MYIAYSSLNNNNQQKNQATQPESDIQLRYQAYQSVCNIYSQEIAAIQKYLPGWTPKFR